MVRQSVLLLFAGFAAGDYVEYSMVLPVSFLMFGEGTLATYMVARQLGC